VAKFLVTGATGFLGNAVARQLLEAGHEVRVLSRVNSERKNISDLNVEIVTGDLSDPGSLRGLARGCKGLFHVAADYRLWVPKPELMYRANVEGSQALVRFALEEGVDRIVYTSSVATLKITADEQLSDENSLGQEQDMIGHYKRSKFLAEQKIRDAIAEGAQIVMVSPTAPIGPRDIKPTPTGKIIVDAANGKMPAYLDTGLNVAHVDDVALGHWLAYERGTIGENYILGSENLLLKDILSIVAERMGRRAPGVELSPAMIKPIAHFSEFWARTFGGDPLVPLDGVRMAEKKMFFSHAKATEKLNYAPRPAACAIEDALDWFIAHGYVKRKKVKTADSK